MRKWLRKCATCIRSNVFATTALCPSEEVGGVVNVAVIGRRYEGNEFAILGQRPLFQADFHAKNASLVSNTQSAGLNVVHLSNEWIDSIPHTDQVLMYNDFVAHLSSNCPCF
jgi:hypothetical protein